MRSGHNELQAEELVTWKVAGELMTLSISHMQMKGDDTGKHTPTHTHAHTHTKREKTRGRENRSALKKDRHKNVNENQCKDLLMLSCSDFQHGYMYEYFTVVTVLKKKFNFSYCFGCNWQEMREKCQDR